jgi:hypothetical protein
MRGCCHLRMRRARKVATQVRMHGFSRRISMNDRTGLVSAAYLKRLIRRALIDQGYKLARGRISLDVNTKEAIRRTHSLAVRTQIQTAESALRPHEPSFLQFIADGYQVQPADIQPRLVIVQRETPYSLLFRYAALHWSIPTSNGYGRRIRFLVFDQSNGKLMGVLAVSDPVFSLRARDEWIGWTFDDRKQRLYNVMDAYILGAVPPYSDLLCGKFVAMAAASRDVRAAFRRRYKNRQTVIRQRLRPAKLALVTTTSALGRSSLYNRLKFNGRLLFRSVGYTSGWGTFHFSNSVYEKMLAFAHANCIGTAKAEGWGGGEFRNRKEVIRKCLQVLGFPQEWLQHQIRREIFVAPLAQNTCQFLCGQSTRLRYWDEDLDTYFAYFKERWLLPRARRDPRYAAFKREQWRLW